MGHAGVFEEQAAFASSYDESGGRFRVDFGTAHMTSLFAYLNYFSRRSEEGDHGTARGGLIFWR